MTDDKQRPSLKEFDAYADRNGQDLGQDSPLDVGLPQRTQSDLRRDPGGEAETARIASGQPQQDATDATEAETPPENLRRLKGETTPSPAATEAIDRATAAVGQDDGQR
ncbi:hypothetical protein [Methylobacterium aerolatum]|uniref:Uncharacterized protein n=1 Tax=Methylobacterium aerolatum TaxID=418708 RepID=A0ABU0HZ44_9HYPH|nr:hypothetical protein [Methylobacterium aerolatum]MDQ0447617.1 hypothetical protein [Methylobacterium aerolatum]GJD34717.1 hypothetical protein FMGBMHLM_1620 [Methylobacterium aerolatum]